MNHVSHRCPLLTKDKAAGAPAAPPFGQLKKKSKPALQGGVKFALEEAPTRLSFLVGLGRLAPCLKQVTTRDLSVCWLML